VDFDGKNRGFYENCGGCHAQPLADLNPFSFFLPLEFRGLQCGNTGLGWWYSSQGGLLMKQELVSQYRIRYWAVYSRRATGLDGAAGLPGVTKSDIEGPPVICPGLIHPGRFELRKEAVNLWRHLRSQSKTIQ